MFFLSIVPSVYADRGLIPIDPEISVYEPSQKAIIAWDGEEEILILSTDINSIEETYIVEILPLPSNPLSVEIANFESFEEIQKLILDKGRDYFGKISDNRAFRDIEVLFHEKLGAHDITIVKANDALELVAWIKKVLLNSSLQTDFSLHNYDFVIENYMNRGFNHYVIDIIKISTTLRSVEPILYRFKTSFIYYPLYITSQVEGSTKITLFILSQNKIRENFEYFKLEKAYYQHEGIKEPIEFWLSIQEISLIDVRIGQLLKNSAWLSVLKYDGELNKLSNDLLLSVEMSEETAKFVFSTSREFLIFWAVLFFTCLVGIIELLSEVKHPFNHSCCDCFIFALYLGLVVGMVLSVFQCFQIVNSSIQLNEFLPVDYQQYVESHRTFSEQLVGSPYSMWIMILLIIVIFSGLYCCKTGSIDRLYCIHIRTLIRLLTYLKQRLFHNKNLHRDEKKVPSEASIQGDINNQTITSDE